MDDNYEDSVDDDDDDIGLVICTLRLHLDKGTIAYFTSQWR